MNYVSDTHALVWYFTSDKRLSRRAFRAFEETLREGLVIVPAMVLAEIMYISKKGRVLLNFGETLKKLEDYDNFEIAPLDVDILKVADSLDVDMEMLIIPDSVGQKFFHHPGLKPNGANFS